MTEINSALFEELNQDVKSNILKCQEDERKGCLRVRSANKCMDDAEKMPIPRKLYDSLIYEGDLSILFADTGIGKSIFAVQMANEISKTDKVLYIDLELSDKQFQKRYSENYLNPYRFNENFFRVDMKRRFSIPERTTYSDYFIQSIKQCVEKTESKIVIVDNMTKIVDTDTDKAQSAKPLMDKLLDLKDDYGLTMLLLEHTRKTDMFHPITSNDMQGSKMKANFVDTVFTIGRSRKDANFRYVKQTKCRNGEEVYNENNVKVYEMVKEKAFLQFKFIGHESEFEHLKIREDEDKTQTIEKVKELSIKGKTQRDIANELNISLGTINKYLKK